VRRAEHSSIGRLWAGTAEQGLAPVAAPLLPGSDLPSQNEGAADIDATGRLAALSTHSGTNSQIRIQWLVKPQDLHRLAGLKAKVGAHPFVVRRRTRNVTRSEQLDLGRDEIWRVLLGCLLTTQQASGADSAVDRLLGARPFPFGLDVCQSASSCERLLLDGLTRFGGIRRTNTIARQAAENLAWLEGYGWGPTETLLRSLEAGTQKRQERAAARTIQASFAGLGPKQSRNMLQWLGLTRYEVPIDSRVVRWLTGGGFPAALGGNVLADRDHYEFVLDGVQALCRAARIYPCLVDAMIFAEREPETWDGIHPRAAVGPAQPSLKS
jgi:hypothetical protein